LPRLGSWVRISSPAPVFSIKSATWGASGWWQSLP